MATVVVVGGSLAGLTSAEALRRYGFEDEIVVLEAASHVPTDRPPLSKQYLSGAAALADIAQPVADQVGHLRLDVRTGVRALSLDVIDRVVVTDAGEVSYDGLIVATGASPRRLPGQPDLAGIHVLRDVEDSDALRADLDADPERVVVIGAGFIGAEVAATCRHRGHEVTLVEALDVPLGRVFGGEIGAAFAGMHRAHGVDLRLGTGVKSFLGSSRVEGVELSDGSVVEAPVVVVGVGVTPSTDWLAGSGLTIDDGVLCDATLLAAPGVVAAGDICRWPNPRYGNEVMRTEHWENAIEQGETAAARVLAELGHEGGSVEPFASVPWFWSDQYDSKIQFAGRSTNTDEISVVDGTLEELRFVALFRQGDHVHGVLGVGRPAKVMRVRNAMAQGLSWADGLAMFDR